MSVIKSASRSAMVSFPTDAPYMAAGTMAGAVDLTFSSDANLEIFGIDFGSDSPELPLAGACSSSDRFNRLVWGKPLGGEEYALGLIAGGRSDGSIGVWNPAKLIGSFGEDNNAFVVPLERHVGAVRGLEFSPQSKNLLASGADEGELLIWDLVNPGQTYRALRNVGSGAQTEISFVSWNPEFEHVLASTSYNGMTAVWDYRQAKIAASFSDGRRCSVLQWNPDNPTRLILASDDDSSPSLRVRDLRFPNQAYEEFVGHTKGVIAMSWCPNDSSYLLSCGKDNRTVCWDTNTRKVVCELPISNNWNFDIHWYPKAPGVVSTSSFDAKINIYNIEACTRLAGGMDEFGAPARLRAPKWLKRPAGASFGFGGKLISFHTSVLAASKVIVNNLVTEHSLVIQSTEFTTAIQNGEEASMRSLCEKKFQDSESQDDKEIWGFMRVLFEAEGTARSKLLDHLGLYVPNEQNENASDDLGKELTNAKTLDDDIPSKGGMAGVDTTLPIDDGEDFFNNPQPSADNLMSKVSDIPSEKVPGEIVEHGGISDLSFDDSSIERALIVGDYKGAVLLCISANKMADALVIAHLGGPLLWKNTLNEFLIESPSPHLKVASALINNDLLGLVNTRPLNSWKETLSLLCTFAEDKQWTVLCETLASRLMVVGDTLAATLCYICSGNIDKTLDIWSHNLKYEHEGRTYVDLLQDLMEKTAILTFATKPKQFSASFSMLVENYVELLASQGLLTIAMDYLNLLCLENYPLELSFLRDRIALCAGEGEAPGSAPESMPQQPYPDYGMGHGSQHRCQLGQLTTPQAPQPTVQTVDTSSVPAQLRPVIGTLTRLFQETSQSNPTRKREIEDTCKRIGSLFAKLNTGDVSPSVASKLTHLCQALDSGNFSGAEHIQGTLTMSDWDECQYWLLALKRMIKTRQNGNRG